MGMDENTTGYWFLVAGRRAGVIIDTYTGTLLQVGQKARTLADQYQAAIWAILGEPTGFLAWPRVKEPVEYAVQETFVQEMGLDTEPEDGPIAHTETWEHVLQALSDLNVLYHKYGKGSAEAITGLHQLMEAYDTWLD